MDLYAKDRATGLGAETAMDVDEAMSRETNEVEPCIFPFVLEFGSSK